MKIPKGGSFDDVAREALCVAEKAICQGDSLATTNPPVAWIEDPYMVEEDFFVEVWEGPTPLESKVPPKPTSPTPAPAQTTPGSARSIPIMQSGKF